MACIATFPGWPCEWKRSASVSFEDLTSIFFVAAFEVVFVVVFLL